jgi:hypothetical protein
LSTAPSVGLFGNQMPGHSLAAPARKRDETLLGFNVYASSQPNVQPTPANLFTTISPTHTTADVSGAPAGSFFVVTGVYDSGESPPSNEVGGPLPTITSVKVSASKITVTGTGFASGSTVALAGFPFTSPAKLKKNNTKVIQKGPLVIGQTVGEFLATFDAGTTLLVFVIDSKGNAVTYPYTK